MHNNEENTLQDEAQMSRKRFLQRVGIAGAGAMLGGTVSCADAASNEAAPRWAQGNAAPRSVAASTRSAVMSSEASVRRFGAKGDGKTDDTRAVQAAIDAVAKAGGHVYFPSGNYRITRTLRINSTERIDITGDGWSSQLMHENDEPLLLWPENVACRECSVRSLRVSGTKKKSVSTPVIACLGGTHRSYFEHLLFEGEVGSGVFLRGITDSIGFDFCQMWGVAGIGIEIGKGSQVVILNGRIIGNWSRREGNIGVLVTGNNGGVNINTTDIIAVHTGLQLGGVGGPGNREIFLTHATFDSSVYGIRQYDTSYVSIAGCWAASSDEAQIQIEESSVGAIMSINGGTIYNGGAYGKPGAKNGLVVRAGSFTMSGVNVMQNQGIGILVEGTAVKDYAISGCRIHNNGTGAVLRSGSRAVTGNIFSANKTDLVDTARGDNPFIGNLLKA